jgi:LacI family transcriptional regulator
MPAKLSDVAKRVGVSPSTVSRALSGSGAGNLKLLEEIRTAAEQVGYPLDRYHASLARSRLLGVVVPNIASPFYASLIERIEQAASDHGFNLLLCNSGYDLDVECSCLQILAEKKVAGILLCPVAMDSSLPGEVTHRRLPVVQVDRKSRHIHADLVQTDGYYGAKEAVALLIAEGYRKVAIISGPLTHSTGRERLQGYAAALSEAGIAELPEYVQVVDFREENGFAAAMHLLALGDRPDALFVTNVDMTIGALRALYEQGLRIPEDIAIVGFDEFPFARIAMPPLTTVEQPVEMLALTAVDLLMRRIEQRTTAEPTTIRLLPKLNVRRSSQARMQVAPDGNRSSEQHERAPG